MTDSKTARNQSMRLLCTVMSGTGALFLLFSAFCLTNLAMVSNFTGVDGETLKMISIFLIFAGVGDLIAARIFLNKVKSL